MSKNNPTNNANKTKNIQKKSMQSLLERLKEFQLTVHLSRGITDTQADLLIKKFEEILKSMDPEYTKHIKMVDGKYYLVDTVA